MSNLIDFIAEVVMLEQTVNKLIIDTDEIDYSKPLAAKLSASLCRINDTLKDRLGIDDE